MVEFNVEKMSENELIEAAKRIFTIQEKDFEKIKSEKWYQTLFHAITLNQDGKKYAVRGIKSLAKLQSLFMGLYVKNYKETYKPLDAVIEAVTQNSESIKRLYGMCVLKLEKQEGLETLDSQDAEILTIFLGEYRDENGLVPKAVRDYNRGVLNALNQKIPTGVLDSHQIRRLKAPKVVYRCFMEQCAVDGTIDTEEWTEKIYEDLKDFELSENSKKEIKESVKYEAEIAGIEYFTVKYTKDNIGILDSDFEIDIERIANPASAEKTKTQKMADILGVKLKLMKFFIELKAPRTYKDEIEEDISNGKIKLACLIDSINKSYIDDIEAVEAIKLSVTDENFNICKRYFLISTIEGFFFFVNEKIAFVKYDDIRSVKQNFDSVIISAWKVKWYSKNGMEEYGENEIVIEKNQETKKYLRGLRKGLEMLIEEFDGYVEPSEDRVEAIVSKYIHQIPKSSSAVSYLVKDFGYSDDKNKKRLKRALTKYALKVREDEAIGFIDTSLFGNGGDGILFSKYGIAFDWAFEKIYAKYEEIDSMEIKKKDLILYGHFSERKNDIGDPSISSIYYNLSKLKECLEEIKCVV